MGKASRAVGNACLIATAPISPVVKREAGKSYVIPFIIRLIPFQSVFFDSPARDLDIEDPPPPKPLRF